MCLLYQGRKLLHALCQMETRQTSVQFKNWLTVYEQCSFFQAKGVQKHIYKMNEDSQWPVILSLIPTRRLALVFMLLFVPVGVASFYWFKGEINWFSDYVQVPDLNYYLSPVIVSIFVSVFKCINSFVLKCYQAI